MKTRQRPSEQARQEQRRRQRAHRRAARDAQKQARSQQEHPPLWGRAPGIPVDWQRLTLANLRSVYPCQTDRGFGDRGVFQGINVEGSEHGFFFDPWEWYPEQLTNPNVIVMGEVGSGKSATVKSLVDRELAVYGPGRFVAVLDPKGEYREFAAALGMPVVRLAPGGAHRVNLMDPPPGSAVGEGIEDGVSRLDIATQLVAAVVGRRLTGLERAVLQHAVQTLIDRGGSFTLRDVATEVSNPSPRVLELARLSPDDVAREAREVAFALDELCERTLKGMFDQPTNVQIDWLSGPGVVVDLSAVYHNKQVLPLVVMSAVHWLGSAIRGMPEGRRVLQVIEEAWAAVLYGAGYFQSSLKLSRTLGLSTVIVCHKPEDLTAQADDGTASAKIAQGLLPDIGTRVLLRHPSELVSEASDLFELSVRERAWLPKLVRGRAIWKPQGRTALVQNVLTQRQRVLFDTDEAMAA